MANYQKNRNKAFCFVRSLHFLSFPEDRAQFLSSPRSKSLDFGFTKFLL